MATSSIIENIRINNPKLIEEYVAALERAETEPVPVETKPKYIEIDDAEKMRQILMQGIERWGKKS